jgi:NAD(P)H-hydrate epimerase
VAARHLHMFRYKPTIYLPKPGSKDIYQRLLRQCENLRIPVVGSADEFEEGLRDQDVIMDAIFGGCGAIPHKPTTPIGAVLGYYSCGATAACRANAISLAGFSFAPPVRKPFDTILRLLESSKLPIVSIDIPSGWSVEDGPQPLYTQPDDKGNSESVPTFTPEVLVSLTAPKQGVKSFKGRHFLGGRFVPE